MKPAPTSPDERRRLEILWEYDVLDTPPEAAFDELAALASHICEAPIALISLVDENRQWFKSRVGVTATETARDISFCGHGIQQRDLFIVADAARDERFADNPLVAAEPHIRFYAGAPLITAGGHALGMLCVIDHVPRELRPDQQHALRVLGRHVMNLLDLRRRAREAAHLSDGGGGRGVTGQDLQESEEELRMFRFSMDQASDAIFWMNREAGFTYVNDEACRSLGYTREELLQLRLWDIDPVFPRERWSAEWEQYQKAGRMGSQYLETLHRRKDGVVFPVEVMAKHMWFGKAELHVAFVRNITGRKRAEEAQARLATAVEQAAEAIVITDPEGTISYVNPAFEKTSGYARAEAIGASPRLLKSGRHDAAFYRQMWDTLRRGEVWTGRVINRKKNGAFYEEEMTISPVLDSAGKTASYVAVQRDVTQEVALEAQLRQAQKMEAIGLLAGGVAHDFNNILTIIQGNASLLMNAQLNPAERSDCSQQIARAAERASGLIRQLLMFSRKQVMQPANVNLNEVVAQTAKMLQRILGEDIALQTNYGRKLAPIWADTGMMEQVLLNLVINSRDAMPEGGRLTISTGSATLDEKQAQQNPDAAAGLHVWLDVTDTGCGIAPEDQTRIFEPFFTTKEAGKGTGLGLATVYGIVKQHHGWITVTSEIQKGTTFRICFPAVVGARAEEKAVPAAAPLPRGTETLLVVEDDLPLRLLVCNLLQRCGYSVLQAQSGAAAVKIWQEQREQIQLLFTDLVMPDGMTGRQLAERLQSDKPSLKVIYTSGYSTEVGKGLSLIEGVNFLQKPYPSGKLARTVRECLDRE
jgi:two-component system cell cycle sensor histidine kinase/response regulator CckA